jgi:Fic family protein
MSELLYKLNPDRTQPWNALPDLPIHKDLYLNVDVLEKLGNAKAALARLHGRSAVIPNQGILINSISLQEAKYSSEIENIFTTDDDLYKAFSDQQGEANSASKEVLRYREALWSGYQYLEQKDKFDPDYFLLVFREIKQTQEGFRQDFIHTTIKQGGTGPNAGKVVYTPPRGSKIIQEKLANLIDFLNDDEQYNIDHLIKMVIAHYQFEAIHPFRDGNGRTGRILNIHYLTNKGLLDRPILYLSKYILHHKDDYYKYLQAVSQRGDWKSWFLYMLQAITETSNYTYHKINEIVAVKDAITLFLSKETKIKKTELLASQLFVQPYIKVKHLVDAGLYAENTARDYLNKLCDLGVLDKKEIEGKHYYLNLELHRILSE